MSGVIPGLWAILCCETGSVVWRETEERLGLEHSKDDNVFGIEAQGAEWHN